MTDRELSVADWNERAARALGLELKEINDAGDWHYRVGSGEGIEGWQPLPDFHGDPATLPVLLAAIAERGWTLRSVFSTAGSVAGIERGREADYVSFTAPTLQAAVCEAWVLAVEGGAK